MPELPEVQTVIATLEKQMGHPVITGVSIIYPRILANKDPEEFSSALKGQKIEKYGRRGKFLLFTLTDYLLVAHLRMEGKFYYFHEETQPYKHTHLVFELDNGELHYNDVRKFGRFYLYSREEEPQCLGKLGLEPFDVNLTPQYLKDYCRDSHTAIKSQLLDQQMIAGIGNIYANEICFACHLDALRPAGFISPQKWEEIIHHTARILAEAIEQGGTTIRSYTSSLGVTGLFQQNLYVQSRQGEECRVCGSLIEKTRVNGRGTYYCPKCQKKEPIVIALTGSIGSGKTEVCGILLKKGYPVISCDDVNSQLMKEKETLDKLAEILDCPAEQLDRKYIASRIFSNEEDRRQVEEYLHGEILKRIWKWISENEDKGYLFVEVPLLFEVGWDRFFDYSLLVYADEEALYKRLNQHRFMTPEQVRERLAAQMSVEEKLKRCDGSIRNNTTLKKLGESVESFLSRLPAYGK
ncbi:MAG: DNA-formamidopyrimidine glycosylase [Erysipelotrichaceae bacterium]|nr:DNA-formamidopyrimidine glycosylase [Erysipelotrichaceae bacterium]